MSKRSQSIYLRKDGRWEARCCLGLDENGKRKYKAFYAYSREEVSRKLNEFIRKLEEEELKSANNLNVPFEIIAKQWLQVQRTILKINSYSQYEQIIRVHIIPKFGKYSISKITSKEIDEFAKELKNLQYSKRTVQGIIQLTNRIIDFAKVSEQTKIWDNEDEIILQIIPTKQLKRFIKFLKTDINESKLGLLCVVYLGIRVGELCALKWGDIDFDKSEMTLNKTMQRITDTTASEVNRTRVVIMKIEERKIPIPKVLIDILYKYRGKDTEYLLTSDSKNYLEPRTVQYQLNTFSKSAKIFKTSFSSLRDTFAVRAIELEMDLRFLAEIMGVNFEGIKKYLPYANVSFDKFEEINKMNKL